MRAVITYGGNLVSIENLVQPEFAFNGFLSTFWYKNKAVRYCHMDTVRENVALNDYYYWNAYSDYIKNIITIDELVDKHKFTHFDIISTIEPSTEPVNIFVEKLYLSPPNYSELFFAQLFKWDLIPNEEIVGRDNQLNTFIIMPQRAIDNPRDPIPETNAIPVVQSFYDKNKYLISAEEFSINPLEIARILNRICWIIQRICEDIFPLFSSDSVFNSYITRQKEEWTDDTIMEEPDYYTLNAYYDGLYDFYYSASLYRVNIHKMKGKEKLHFLARILWSKALSIMPLEDRMNVLKQMVSMHLSSTFKVEIEEQIVIRIVRSFGFNERSDRNTFLTRIVNPDFNGDGEEGKTMYEVLYERMSTAWEITRSTIELMNWAFNATWKPTDTRGMFVKSIYALWIRSKYNQYDFDTFELRENSLGLKKLVDGVAHYQTNEIDSNDPINFSTTKPDRTYFYTSYPGYKILPETEDVTERYVDAYWEAAPIMLNYNSKKSAGFHIDNYSFEFSQHHIIARLAHYEGAHRVGGAEIYALYGKYDILQPVHLISSSLDTAEPMLVTEGEEINFNGSNINSLVPVFFLKYVDDFGDSKDVQHFMGVAFDVISTFIPVANLAKLRHIRHLTRFGQAMLVVETVQIVAGVLNVLLEFVDECNAEGTLCKKVRTMLFYIELSSMGTDGIMMNKARKSAKDTVDEAIENGWPDELLQEVPDTGGLTPKMKLEELAGGAAQFLNRYKNKIKSNVIEYVSKNNEFSLNNIHTGNPLHSEAQIDEILNNAYARNLTASEAEDLLAVSYRKKKQLSTAEVIEQTDNWALVIKPRKYPYLFASLEEFQLFKAKIIELANDFGIPTHDVRIQGSSLRKATTQDVDIAFYFKQSQKAMIENKIKSRIKEKFTDPDTGEMSPHATKNYDKAIAKIDIDLEKGIIRSINFGKFEGKSFSQTYYDRLILAEDLDASIIIANSQMDLGPYLKF